MDFDFNLAEFASERKDDLEEDWQMVPDGDGNMHMVDINHLEPEPAFNAHTQVRFLLFTTSNRNTGQVIALNNAGQLSSSHFNAAHQVR